MTKRVGVIQSNYIPWRGYFDFINSVDLFIFHDDIQYTKGDWRNRNKIKTRTGTRWLTVPVKYERTSQWICETKIDYSTNWKRDHLNQFRENYSEAPYFRDALEILENGLNYDYISISWLNIHFIRLVCEYLGIQTELGFSSDYRLGGSKTDRLIELLTKTKATTYVSGPAGRNYLNEDQFRENGITLEYKTYHYPPYKQLWYGFEGAVTVLDLIANCGPDQSLLKNVS